MSRESLLKLVVGVLFVLATGYFLLVSDPRPPEPGTWDVRGKDRWFQWEAELVLESRGRREFGGHFVWKATGTTVLSGRELVVGSFEPKTRRLRLRGVAKQDEKGLGIGLGEYEATVSMDGRTLENGTWGPAPMEGVVYESGVLEQLLGEWSAHWERR